MLNPLRTLPLIALAAAAMAAAAQPAAPDASAPTPAPSAAAVDEAVQTGVDLILSMQEGDGPAEWPYEGVYRVGGEIPIGYRVGGTGICACAVMEAPGYADSPERRKAVERATRFVIDARKDPLMNPADRDGAGYDVRGWGYTFGLRLLLTLEQRNLTPAGMDKDAKEAARFYVHAIEQTEIPKVGGWNYAGASGPGRPYPMSPFMTGPTLQVLFQARSMGYEVDDAVVDRALDALERARTVTGSFVYAGAAGRRVAPVAGAVGRMLVSETTLYLAGRGSLDRVRGAIDAFIVHWDQLDARRAKTGTHKPPYGIAPYYFYYAHYYAAQAIGLLPPADRPEYTRHLNELVFRNRIPDGAEHAGGWDDRVFPRTANYSTAMCVMALLAPNEPKPDAWKPGDAPDSTPDAAPEGDGK